MRPALVRKPVAYRDLTLASSDGSVVRGTYSHPVARALALAVPIAAVGSCSLLKILCSGAQHGLMCNECGDGLVQ